MKLNELLAKMPGYIDEFHKFAGVEQADQRQQEVDFGRIAYNFLVDRASALIPYLIGFEVVERKEEGSRCVGMFSFKVGKEFYYVPTFFINNQIKGMDSIFAKSTNMFMPLTEAWVSFIANRNVMEIGKGQDRDISRTLGIPNVNFLRRPEYYPKSGSVKDMVDGGREAYSQITTDIAAAMDNDSAFQLALGGAVAKMAGDALEESEYASDRTLVSFIENHGGPEAVIATMERLGSDVKFANAFLSFYPDVKDIAVAKFSDKVRDPVKAAAKVEIVSQSSECMPCSLSDEEKPKLIRDSFVVRDYRKPEEQSEIYDVDYVKRFSNPVTSGKYNVLLANGGTAVCYVVMPKLGNRKAVVVSPNGEQYSCGHSHRIYVRGEELPDGDIYAAAVPTDSMELGSRYLLVDEKGCGFGPFRPEKVVSVDGERITVEIYDRSVMSNSSVLPLSEQDFSTLTGTSAHCGSNNAERVYKLQLSKHNSDKLIVRSEVMMVPANWKAFKLGNDSWGSASTLPLGTLADLDAAMCKAGAYPLTVTHKSGSYSVRLADLAPSNPMNYKTAELALVCHLGLTVPDAEQLLKKAEAEAELHRLVKFGQLVGVTPASVPDMQSLGMQGYDTFMNVPMSTPYSAEYPSQMTGVVPPLPNVNNPWIAMGGQSEADLRSAGQLAEAAAAGGQKQVFDHAAIAGLSKVYDTGAILDTYIPELMKCLDRLGRILFLFYWKNEDFAERYGTDSLSEMEDTLKGTFQSLGDLALKLRQKTVSGQESVMPLE